MALVTTTEMFKKAYDGGYAIGAFNVNNMEIVQGITEAAAELKSPVILQASAGARKYANSIYLKKLVEAAVELYPEIPIALHLDHGANFQVCKECVDGGFTSVMIDYSGHDFEENVAESKKVADYAHEHGVVVEAELGTLAGIEDAVSVDADKAMFTDPDQVEEFVKRTGVDSKYPEDFPDSRSFCTVLLPFRRNMSRSSTRTAALLRTRSASLRTSSVWQRKAQSARSTSTLTFVLV